MTERVVCTCMSPDGRKCGAAVYGVPYRCPYHGLLADEMTETIQVQDETPGEPEPITGDYIARKLSLLAEGKQVF